jgi:hypothetical protein
VPHIDTPDASLHWSVGDTIQFSGSATDPEDGDLPASALSWQVILHHCVGATCHEHFLQTFDGVASGSFPAPDHPYPSYLELRLTATDSHGAAVATSLRLDPATTTLAVKTSPSGLPVTVGGTAGTSPVQVTLIRGGSTSLATPLTTNLGATRYRFWAWSDGLTRAHDVTVTDPATRTATFVPDAPDTCATAKTVTAGAWTSDRASGNGDVDWFRFGLPGTRRVVITLGNLPVDATLQLVKSCSSPIASSNQAGTHFERLTRSLTGGTYRVRVSVPSGAKSLTPYVLRVLVINHTVALESATAARTGSTVRVVGAVVNGTGSTVGRVAVTATFKDAHGHVVKTLTGTTFANRLGDGAASPFALAGAVPTYASVSYRLVAGKPAAAQSLSLLSVTAVSHPDGTETQSGRVRNVGSTTATAVMVARTWYGTRGEVLDTRAATLVPSTLAPGATGTFSLVRPKLSTIQATGTLLRAS